MARFNLMKAGVKYKRHYAIRSLKWLYEKTKKIQFKENDFVLGLDISKFSTGYCVLKVNTKGEYEIVEKGVIEGNNQVSLLMNVQLFSVHLDLILNKYKPKIIGYEAISVAENFTGIRALSINFGVLLSSIQDCYKVSDYPLLISVQNTSGKKLATGMGRSPFSKKFPAQFKTKQEAEKARVMDGIKARFNLDFSANDEADAFLVGFTALSVVKQAEAYPSICKDLNLKEDIDLNSEDEIHDNSMKFFKLMESKYLVCYNNLYLADKNLDQELKENLADIVGNIIKSPTLIKENEINEYQKIFKKVRPATNNTGESGEQIDDPTDPFD